MGSPPIAVATLEALVDEYEVALVATQPDRPKGRGRRMSATAVHERADRFGIEVVATEDVNGEEAAARLRAAAPDVIVVVSFGQILKEPLLELPRLGCLNVHFSLLPKLRGAAPIAWAIIRGHRKTGVSIIRMVRKMDAGAVLAQVREAIRNDDTAATLGERLGHLGARLLRDTLERHSSGETVPKEQAESQATFAPKITRATAGIDWAKSAAEVDRLIRGLSGELEAYAFFGGGRMLRVNLFNSAPAPGPSPGVGVAARGAEGELVVGCGEGAVEIKEIQAEGRRRLSGKDFANGYHIRGGECFHNGRQGARHGQ